MKRDNQWKFETHVWIHACQSQVTVVKVLLIISHAHPNFVQMPIGLSIEMKFIRVQPWWNERTLQVHAFINWQPLMHFFTRCAKNVSHKSIKLTTASRSSRVFSSSSLSRSISSVAAEFFRIKRFNWSIEFKKNYIQAPIQILLLRGTNNENKRVPVLSLERLQSIGRLPLLPPWYDRIALLTHIGW